MTKEKIKTFVKDHKREIIIVATAIAGTACAIIGIKKIKKFIAFGNDVKEKI